MNILIRPIVTEKMTKQGETLNRYGFIVDKRAEKLQIKKQLNKCTMLKWKRLILCVMLVS